MAKRIIYSGPLAAVAVGALVFPVNEAVEVEDAALADALVERGDFVEAADDGAKKKTGRKGGVSDGSA